MGQACRFTGGTRWGVWVWGGVGLQVLGGMDAEHKKLSSVERYDPRTNRWEDMPGLDKPRICRHGRLRVYSLRNAGPLTQNFAELDCGGQGQHGASILR